MFQALIWFLHKHCVRLRGEKAQSKIVKLCVSTYWFLFHANNQKDLCNGLIKLKYYTDLVALTLFERLILETLALSHSWNLWYVYFLNSIYGTLFDGVNVIVYSYQLCGQVIDNSCRVEFSCVGGCVEVLSNLRSQAFKPFFRDKIYSQNICLCRFLEVWNLFIFVT